MSESVSGQAGANERAAAPHAALVSSHRDSSRHRRCRRSSSSIVTAAVATVTTTTIGDYERRRSNRGDDGDGQNNGRRSASDGAIFIRALGCPLSRRARDDHERVRSVSRAVDPSSLDLGGRARAQPPPLPLPSSRPARDSVDVVAVARACGRPIFGRLDPSIRAVAGRPAGRRTVVVHPPATRRLGLFQLRRQLRVALSPPPPSPSLPPRCHCTP